MADTKKENEKQTQDSSTSSTSAQPLELGNSQKDLLNADGTSVASQKTPETSSEDKKEDRKEEARTEPKNEQQPLPGGGMFAEPEGEGEGARRQVIALVAGLIIGALITSIFI